MTAWISRARKTFDSFGRTTRSHSSPVTSSTVSDEAVESPGALPRGEFVVPVGEGADPSVVRDGDRFLWCQAEGNIGVSIWVSDRLTSMGTKHVVWMAEPEGPCSKEVWAPEIHRIDGRWHIYFAASDGNNRNHRTFVLVADTDDPVGPYTVHGPLFTGDEPGGDNLWSIDFTVLQHQGRLYGIWSGWPDPDTDLQHLYAAELSSPTEIKSGRVRLLEAGTFDWQRIDETPKSRGLLEGPRAFTGAGSVYLSYACAASWLSTYKVGLMQLTGADPLDPSAWVAHNEPAFASSASTYGVGHGSFVEGDSGQWWYVFHSKIDPHDGWRRTLHVQPITVSDDGRPVFGTPLSRGEVLPVPVGTPSVTRSDAASWTFGTDGVDDFDYYGHHQFFELSKQGLELGRIPAAPVNDFRSAEKFVLRDGDYTDLSVETTFQPLGPPGAMGVLFRTTGPSIGYDTQRGYFACVSLKEHLLLLGRTDGKTWTTVGHATLQARTNRPLTLRVTAQGSHIFVTCSGAAIDLHDDHYSRGSIGVRVVDCHVRYDSLSVTPR